MLRYSGREPWWRIAARVSLLVAVGVLPVSMIGALSVQIQAALGIGEQAIGAAFAVFFGSASLSSILLGYLTERIGARSALQLGALIAVIVPVGIAVGGRSWISLPVLLAAAGVGSALSRPAGSLLIARVIPEGRQGLAFGLKQSSVPVATLLAGIAVPSIGVTLGWRWAYVLAAAIALVALLLVPNGAGGARLDAPVDRSGDLPSPLLVVLGIGVALGTAGGTSLAAFTVGTAVSAGIGEGAAGLLFAVSSVIGLTARILYGHLADVRSFGSLKVTAVLLAVGALAFVMLATGIAGVVMVAAPLAFATAWGWLGLLSFAVVRTNPGAPGAATGVTQMGAFVGGVAGPLILGAIAEGSSFGATWSVAAVFSFAASVAILGTRRLILGATPVPARMRSDGGEHGHGD